MRILAPLLVLAVFGVVAVRWAADPLADREREWIRDSWDLATQRRDVKERLVARLEGQLERYGDEPETRWFAARAWIKIGEVGRALDAVWSDPALADAPGTARRFGALLLRGLGFVDDERPLHGRQAGVLASIILTTGGDEAAATWLENDILGRTGRGFLDVVEGTYLYGDRGQALRVAGALRERGRSAPEVLAALVALAPEAYPERDADLQRLEAVVLRETDRQQERLVWSTACIALGRSEDPRALDVLAGLRRRLSESTRERDLDDAGVVAAALLAGGRWAMLEPLRPFLRGRGPRSIARVWYTEAVQDRIERGDPEAGDAWLTLWQALLRDPDPRLLERMAAGLLLREAAPPPHVPVERVLATLEAEAASPAMHAIAAAWRYRAGEPGGRDDLLDVLRRLWAGGWTQDRRIVPDPLWYSPVLTAARALYRYDPTARP